MKNIVWVAAGCLLFLAGETWASMNADLTLCAQGSNQSPVNIQQGLSADLSPLVFDYTGLVTQIHNKGGQDILASYASGSFLYLEGSPFALQYLAFRSPSEHQVEGTHFPLEVQLVHSNPQGQQVILAVLYELGAANPALHRLLQVLPETADTTVGMASRVRAEQFLPANHAYYRVNGSLTTPPCSEGVLWLIMQERLRLSEEQLQHLHHIIGSEGNNRPIQNLNARMILQSP